MKFMIGQRVIYDKVICTVAPTPAAHRGLQNTWPYYVNNPEKGYVHGVAEYNIKPLPHNQL